jgi:Acyl carrier protein
MLNETESKVMEILREQSEINDEILKESKLIDLGLNSLSFIKIVVALEKEFDFKFDIEDLNIERFETFSSISDYVEAKLKALNKLS